MSRGACFQEARHGSPHSFAQFSTEAIGIGEGVQVHGWGLYFVQGVVLVGNTGKDRYADSNLLCTGEKSLP